MAPPDGVMSDYMASLEKLGRRPETLRGLVVTQGAPSIDGRFRRS
jgi:hypothetical protein